MSQGEHSTNPWVGAVLICVFAVGITAASIVALRGDPDAVARVRATPSQARTSQATEPPATQSSPAAGGERVTAQELANRLVLLVATSDVDALKAILEASGEPCAYGASWGWYADQAAVAREVNQKMTELRARFPDADIAFAEAPTQAEVLADISVAIALVQCRS
jgi:hypothetical protein